MALNLNLKMESSRFISAVLINTLESCREGDFELLTQMGLSLQTMRALNKLKADQIHSIAENYVRDVPNLKFLPLDSAKLTRIIEIEAAEALRYEMIDEFLKRGACKEMMSELFGLRSTQVASRKRFLDVPTVKGRLPATTLEEQRIVYDSWLASLGISDVLKRMLAVAESTDVALSQIYREVKIIEEVTGNPTGRSTNNVRQICA